ncbi:glycogen synthase GlgA [Paraburkholderia sp. Ac-20340]|uniref:glycogen synthase GlgA n=1 Tax=Paraburkholderia sp. Ac-20340 TaxID=2703888 RepID=UPI00197FA485|nr:glycogen synthase GlgA [Paraburkholderia sp. Ac-20340]MBN3858834.1 glycogen synthase GlgA [Paraburkholderia sp. Ac-20340]
MVAAEAAPLAKSGGLGDMVSSQSMALRRRGVDVSILLPGYECAFERVIAPTPLGYIRDLPGGDARLWRAAMPDSDVPVLLLQMDHLFAGRGSGLYQDECGRDYIDNFARFASLSAAAARIATGVRGVKRPRVVHAHDWHAGLTPLLMKLAGASARSVFTIHNLAFQGNYPLGLAPYAGIPSELLAPAPREPRSIEFYDTLSFMKAAIVHADRLTAVSERYAREILTPHFGNRMEGVLAAHAHKLTGIVNGIDDAQWNPLDDPALAQPYSHDDLAGKHACKKALQHSYGLRVDPFAPLVAIGSRLSAQKLADVVCEALPAALARWPRVQFVVLGQGDAAIEQTLRGLAAAWPGRLGLHIGYDEARAHRLHAGADILLHASRFEPCGLTQLYAMRYGTIPVASRVGGLADTIIDCPPRATNQATGFLFDGERASDLFHALGRAFDAFAQPQTWRVLQRNAMQRDSSWQTSAARYHELYLALTGVPGKPGAHAPRNLSAAAKSRRTSTAQRHRRALADVRRIA